PHVFCSSDPKHPLVISAGRYIPPESAIWLADLWVPQGSALYIAPKPDNAQCIDLHNNRNSARATQGDLDQSTLTTQTTLYTNPATFYYLFENHPTNHSRPEARSS